MREIFFKHIDKGRIAATGLGQAHEVDPRLAQRLIIRVHDHRYGRMTVERHADAVPHHTVKRADFHRAVQIGTPGFDIFGHLRGIAAEVDHHAVHRQNTGHALCIGQLHVLAQMTMLAMHRDQHLRLHDIMQRFQIRAVCVTGDVVETGGIINHIHTHLRELVDDADHAAFIARDGFG